MSPVNKHLQYFDLTDFSAGEWTDPGSGTHLLMPNTGAQQMDDCYPQPQGGLRAFFASTSLTTSGVIDITNEICTGVAVVGGYSRRTGAPGETGTVYYMTTWNNSTNRAHIYRMDGTNGDTAWHSLFASAATADNSADRRHSSFVHFVTEAGTDYLMVALRSSVDSGLYTVQFVNSGSSLAGHDGECTKISVHCGALAVTQARVLIGGRTVSDNVEEFRWSAVGDIAFTGATAGSLTPNPSASQNGIMTISAFDPDQILLGFQGASWYTITGDINSSSTPVRQMGDGHYPGTFQDPIRTPDGLIFLELNGPAYMTDGRTFTDLTPQLAPFGFVQTGLGIISIGRGEFVEGFTFLPGGLVSHEESKGWFHTSDQEAIFLAGNAQVGLISADSGVNFTLRTRKVGRFDGTRASTWTWRGAPIAQPNGTQTEIREVVIQGQCAQTCSYAITLTDHLGGTVTANTGTLAAGKHASAIPMLIRGDYADVKLVATASSGEAPIVERIRLGMGMGHSL